MKLIYISSPIHLNKVVRFAKQKLTKIHFLSRKVRAFFDKLEEIIDK